MKSYSLSHLSDGVLLRDLAALLAQDRRTTASMLAHLAEVDARKLYLPSAYPSMYAYCVGELRLSEDSAYKRIRAGRAARRFPVLFDAIAYGRLHLGAVVLLSPYLTEENAEGLIAGATHKTKAEIELILAQRFPKPDLVTCVQPIGPAAAVTGVQELVCEGEVQLAPGPVVFESETSMEPGQRGLRSEKQVLPAQPESPAPRAKLAPLSPERFAMQLTISAGTHEKLRYAQALLGHAVPSGDLAAVLDRALDALIPKLEQRRFAATARTRPGRRSHRGRYVPAHVRRAVWQRDGGQCTFVADHGRRCEARTRLEFDHVDPVARGGESTADRIRLRCRAHNQYEAERVFGERFMRGRREEATRRAADTQGRKASAAG